MAILCNGRKLPFTLYFQDKYEDKKPISSVWKNAGLMERDNLAVIKENMKIGVVFSVDQEDDYDPDSTLKIQTSLFNESDMQVEIECPLQIGTSQITWLYQERKNEEYPWRMGIYLLEIRYKGEKYVSGVFVKPLHLSNGQVLWMHDYLEHRVDGLIYDFIYSKRSASAPINVNLTSYWYYDYARYIRAIQDEFMYAMTMIVKSPIENVVGGYEIAKTPKKMDRKSIQWSLGSKGMAKNAGVLNQQFYKNKKKFSVYQTRENEWIKNVLIEWKYNVGIVKELLKKDYQKLLLKQKAKETELEKQKLLQTSFIGKTDVAVSTKKDVQSKIKMAQREIDETERMAQTFDDWFETFRSFESKIGYFTNETFLKDVSRGDSKPILKKPSYFRIDKMFEESNKVKKENGDKERYITILKPTWKIYEYFCLFEAMEALRTNGFEMIGGVDETFLNVYKHESIPEGTKFEMENDQFLVHIWYDKYHAHSANEAKEKNDNFYIHNPRKKPDIKMDLYEKNENGTLLFHSCLVMDAKFRKLTNIYNQEYINSTTEQLTGYTTFFYCGEHPRLGSKYAPCVDRVLCLYASNDGNEVMRFIPPITYIKLFPYQDDNGTHDIIGSYELTETVKEWIKER